MMKLHQLKNTAGARRRKMRVGCGSGSGRGKTCGRGHKGQYARSGHKHKAAFEGGQMRLLRRIPKRGFNRYTVREEQLVGVEKLNVFENGSVADASAMKEAGIVKSERNPIKILGSGELKKKLTVRADSFTAGAAKKIGSAGGQAETVRCKV